MKKIASFLVVAMIASFSPAWAVEGPVDKELAKLADHDSYLVKAPGMVLHGLYEIGEAPLESVNQPFDRTIEKKDYAFGLFKGINAGAYNVLNGFTRGTFNIFRALVPGMGRYQDKQLQKRVLPVLGS